MVLLMFTIKHFDSWSSPLFTIKHIDSWFSRIFTMKSRKFAKVQCINSILGNSLDVLRRFLGRKRPVLGRVGALGSAHPRPVAIHHWWPGSWGFPKMVEYGGPQNHPKIGYYHLENQWFGVSISEKPPYAIIKRWMMCDYVNDVAILGDRGMVMNPLTGLPVMFGCPWWDGWP